ncbi:MAG: Mur ligase family protein [Bacteroidales bacterium]
MTHIHFISIGEPTLCNLAIALHKQGFKITSSFVELGDNEKAALTEYGLLPDQEGFFEENIVKGIDFVVPALDVDLENVELKKARELNLQVVSFPEFVYWLTKDKVRLVISGSQGKNTILGMMLYALSKHKIHVDFVALDPIKGINENVRLSYDARIVLLVGTEIPIPEKEKKPFHQFYRPHIVVIPNLQWAESEYYPTHDSYMNAFKILTERIEREGKFIFHENDFNLEALANSLREDITAMPYQEDLVVEGEGKTYLKNRFGLFSIHIKDEYFLRNLSAARLACRQLGLQDKDFYAAISEYSFL